MNSQYLIQIVEDEFAIRRLLRTALSAESYQVQECGTLLEARQQLALRAPQLMILDLGLSDGEGQQLIPEVHAASIPILVLSARSSEREKIAALDAGADDYLTKPFASGELLARVRALLRRNKLETSTSHVFGFGEIEVNLDLRQVRKQGQELHLTPIEYRLLSVLLSNPNRVLTYRELLRMVWGSAPAENQHYLRIYMSHLRHKLEQDPTQPQFFLTETGVGYRFVPDSGQ